jgi:hypothetical protein
MFITFIYLQSVNDSSSFILDQVTGFRHAITTTDAHIVLNPSMFLILN